MPKFEDLTGRRFGKLTVLYRVTDGKGHNTRWQCVCDCGREHSVHAGHLKNGSIKDCGCEKSRRTTLRNLKHGDSRTRLYNIWIKMRDRCNNPRNKDYELYGGRGIKVCTDWENSYPSFKEWALSNGYTDELSIDRIEVNKGYEPENCRWASNIVQANNKRDNRRYEYRGKLITIREASTMSGLQYSTIKARLKYGWSMEKAINTPLDTDKWKQKHKEEG